MQPIVRCHLADNTCIKELNRYLTFFVFLFFCHANVCAKNSRFSNLTTAEENMEYNCYPDDPTPTIVSTVYTIAALTGALCVSIAGGLVGYKKAKTKKLRKMTAQQHKLQQHKQEHNHNSLKVDVDVDVWSNKFNSKKTVQTQNVGAKKIATSHTDMTSLEEKRTAFKENRKNNLSSHREKGSQDDIETTAIEDKKPEKITIVTSNDDVNNNNLETKSQSKKNVKLTMFVKNATANNEVNVDKNALSFQDALESEQLAFNICDKKFLWYFIYYSGKEAWNKKRCYFPFITHIVDQATDIAVIIKFYQIYKFESENEYNCPKINGAYLFWLSVASFSVYRIISCIWIYNITDGKKLDTLSQLFDLKLYHALYINFVLNKESPSNPQRYLQILEAALESFPQCVIQLYYLVKVGFNNFQNDKNSSDEIIVTSLIFSILNVSSKMISEDKAFFPKEWHSLNFRRGSDENQQCVNVLYLLRVLLRLLDIVHRLLLILLTWVILGGPIVFAYLCFEFVSLLTIGVKLKQYVHRIVNVTKKQHLKLHPVPQSTH